MTHEFKRGIHYWGDRSGLSAEIRLDGIHISGWYDSMVGIDADGFLSWEQIENERFSLERKAKKRKP